MKNKQMLVWLKPTGLLRWFFEPTMVLAEVNEGLMSDIDLRQFRDDTLRHAAAQGVIVVVSQDDVIAS